MADNESKDVKVAKIARDGVIAAAVITGIFALLVVMAMPADSPKAPDPTPTPFCTYEDGNCIFPIPDLTDGEALTFGAEVVGEKDWPGAGNPISFDPSPDSWTLFQYHYGVERASDGKKVQGCVTVLLEPGKVLTSTTPPVSDDGTILNSRAWNLNGSEGAVRALARSRRGNDKADYRCGDVPSIPGDTAAGLFGVPARGGEYAFADSAGTTWLLTEEFIGQGDPANTPLWPNQIYVAIGDPNGDGIKDTQRYKPGDPIPELGPGWQFVLVTFDQTPTDAILDEYLSDLASRP